VVLLLAAAVLAELAVGAGLVLATGILLEPRISVRLPQLEVNNTKDNPAC
jgi:hypothetical protein